MFPEPCSHDMDTDPGECKRRNCHAESIFLVREQYLEETGKGLVEATARLCQKHTRQEQPTNLDPVTPDYHFEVRPLTPPTDGSHPTGGSISDQRLTQCPDCGWTGNLSELSVEDGTQSCPACGDDIAIGE